MFSKKTKLKLTDFECNLLINDFIEEFYYGNIDPQECTTNLTAKVKKPLSKGI